MSAKALSTFDVRKISPRDWVFLAPFVVLAVVDGISYLIRVPPSFETDFASVPRIPLAFYLYGGIGDYAAAVHDWLYASGLYPREICDRIFREILVHVDLTSEARAQGMYLGVRLGGAKYYSAD